MSNRQRFWDPRRRARESALRMLYHAEVGGVPIAEAVRDSAVIGVPDAVGLDEVDRQYAVALAEGVDRTRETLDGYIAEAAHNWRLERLTIIDRLVLRLAVHELIAHQDTPRRVVFDEAIELARAYGGDESARFVNGVLDGVGKRVRKADEFSD